jgi:hypothetical protein
MFQKLFLMAAVAIISGCVSHGRDYNGDALLKLKPGVSTIAESIATVGEPYQKTVSSDGEQTLTWAYATRGVRKSSVGVFGADGKLKSFRAMESPK